MSSASLNQQTDPRYWKCPLEESSKRVQEENKTQSRFQHRYYARYQIDNRINSFWDRDVGRTTRQNK